ncbi:LysR family transcriptional regulator [Kribbia dieselivorans]|uniref:LysR family transcriptional regulator n=1 Tax=Kribbia dieselivorans TaxID=331526 RepID=UPI00083848E3|nr:LysR family transcriptional regulator [Kribbia dieselivorans]
MDIHHLRYFLAVADHGGVSGAAAALDAAIPTVSGALRSLERQLGQPLFERLGGGMVLTAAGHALVPAARRTLRAVDAAAVTVPSADGSLHGRLEIHVLPALAMGAVPELVARFRRRHPHVQVDLARLADERKTRSLLMDGRAELVVAPLPFVDGHRRTPTDRQLDTVTVGTQEFWLAYPGDTPLPAHDPIGWEEVPDVPLVVVPAGDTLANEVTRTLAAAGRTPPTSAVLTNREARLSFVLGGVGGTFLERGLAGLARARGAQVRALTPPLLRPFGLVLDPARLSPAAAAFVALAREAGQSASASASLVNAEAAGES